MRASFVMMYCPENPKTRVQWQKRHPFFGPEDFGFTMENYGHGGKTSPEGEGMGQNPPIAGMPEDEFIRRLSAFKSGERQSMMMGIMAKKLSDSDIADLAAYFAEQ